MSTSKGTAAAVLALVWLLCAPSRAQTVTDGDRALAEALFREGKALFDAGNVAPACEKFQASRRLEAAGGTVLALAMCYERSARNASAWAEYQVALALARRDQRADRVELAQQRILELEPALHFVSVRVAESNRQLPGFELYRAGKPLDPAAWDTRVAFDAGSHEFTASARGYVTWQGTLHVPASAGVTVFEVPALIARAKAAETRRAARPAPAPVARRDGRVWGYVLAGTGAVALVSAGYFSLESIAARARVDGACAARRCPSEFADEYRAAQRWDRAAVAAAGTGVVAGAAAAYVLIGAREGSGAEPTAGLAPSRTWLGWSLAGAGASGVALGSVFAVRAVEASNRAWAECRIGNCGDEQEAASARSKRERNVAIVSFAGALAAGGAGLYLLAAPAGDGSARAPNSAWLGVGDGVVRVGGAF